LTPERKKRIRKHPLRQTLMMTTLIWTTKADTFTKLRQDDWSEPETVCNYLIKMKYHLEVHDEFY
jgi:hypothetical protein